MTIEVTQGEGKARKITATIVLADSIRDLSAYRYMLFNQAWAREIGIGSDMYATDGHLARLGPLIGKKDDGALTQYNHVVMAFTNLTSAVPVNYRAAVLAPLVVRINEQAYTDTSEQGLAATATALLATGLTQAQLEEACELSKKNFSKN